MTERPSSTTTPNCPRCEGPMVPRTNSRDGTSFWGCRKFPSCRGTRDAGWESGDSSDESTLEPSAQVKVLWNDATLDRTGWQCRYTTAGGRLRSSPSLIDFSNEFRQCWIARTQATTTDSETVRRVTGAIRKLIQRGSNPPIHPDAERDFVGVVGSRATHPPVTAPR